MSTSGEESAGPKSDTAPATPQSVVELLVGQDAQGVRGNQMEDPVEVTTEVVEEDEAIISRLYEDLDDGLISPIEGQPEVSIQPEESKAAKPQIEKEWWDEWIKEVKKVLDAQPGFKKEMEQIKQKNPKFRARFALGRVKKCRPDITTESRAIRFH